MTHSKISNTAMHNPESLNEAFSSYYFHHSFLVCSSFQISSRYLCHRMLFSFVW